MLVSLVLCCWVFTGSIRKLWPSLAVHPRMSLGNMDCTLADGQKSIPSCALRWWGKRSGIGFLSPALGILMEGTPIGSRWLTVAVEWADVLLPLLDLEELAVRQSFSYTLLLARHKFQTLDQIRCAAHGIASRALVPHGSSVGFIKKKKKG